MIAVGFPKTLLNVKELSSTSKIVKSGARAPTTGAAGKAAISSSESPSLKAGFGRAPVVAKEYPTNKTTTAPNPKSQYLRRAACCLISAHSCFRLTFFFFEGMPHSLFRSERIISPFRNYTE